MANQGAGKSRKPLCTTTVHRVMQMAIAEGLKKWYEPPQELSQELARSGSDDDRSIGGGRRKPPKEISLTDPQAAWVAREAPAGC